MRCIICNDIQEPLIKDLHICLGCGLVSSDLRADTAIYDQNYNLKYQRMGSTELGRQIVEARANLVAKYIPEGRIIDFGCGSGRFIYEMIARGYDAVGFDVNQASGFCAVERLFGEYDAMTGWDSIEHLENPLPVLKKLSTEYVFLCTPNLNNCENILTWRHYRPHEHLHYFEERSLTALITAAGYELVAVDYAESRFRVDGERNIITVVGRKPQTKGVKS